MDRSAAMGSARPDDHDALWLLLFEHAPDAMVLCGEAGEIVEVNRAFERLLGWPRVVIIGHPVDMLVPREMRPGHLALREHYARLPEPRPMGSGRRLQAVHYDGHQVPVEIALSTIDLDGGRRFVATLRDSSERQAFISALEGSEARFRVIFEHASVGMAVLSVDGRLERVNQRLCQITGHERDQLDAMHEQLFAAVPPRIVEDENAADGAAGPTAMEQAIRRPDGEMRWIRMTLSTARVRDGSIRYFIAIVDDIHARRSAARRLAARHSHLRAVLDAVPVAVALLDEDGRILELNAAGLQMLELAQSDLETDPPPVWTRGCSPDTAVQFRKLLDAALHGARGEMEYELASPGGVRQVVMTAVVPHAGEGQQRQALAVTWDVSERRRAEAEVRKSRDELRYAHRLGAVGQLAAAAVHELKNVLTAISGHAEMVVEALSDADPVRPDVIEIVRAGDHGARLTRDLMALGRRQSSDRQSADVNELLGGMLDRLHRLGGKLVRMEARLQPDVWAAHVDVGQFEQVMVNLAMNAREAMPAGGELIVATANVLMDAIPDRPAGGPREYVRVSVADTGVGMDEETRRHACEPFFSTKPPELGSGLGLSIVQGIVAEHGGFLRIRSERGTGTTVEVYLPRVTM